jgi:hypothetical protein
MYGILVVMYALHRCRDYGVATGDVTLRLSTPSSLAHHHSRGCRSHRAAKTINLYSLFICARLVSVIHTRGSIHVLWCTHNPLHFGCGRPADVLLLVAVVYMRVYELANA